MYDKLVLGTFNSEQFWKDNTLANLPVISNPEEDNLVSVMDDLLFVFGQSDKHLVITRYIAEDLFHQYLDSIGFKYHHASIFNNPIGQEETDSNRCIFDLMLDYPSEINSLKDNEKLEFNPYAVTDFTKVFCDMYLNKVEVPDFHAVKKINSKKYSNQLCQKYDIGYGSFGRAPHVFL